MTKRPADPALQELLEEARRELERGILAPEPIEPWWERRRPNELTPDYLGRVLEAAGLPDLAWAARRAHYDDFFAPAEIADGMELLRLVADLRAAAKAEPERAEAIAVIENAVKCGEFDGTSAESERWVQSEDGQAALRELTPTRQVGRNQPCPCGSGRKYKLCHGKSG